MVGLAWTDLNHANNESTEVQTLGAVYTTRHPAMPTLA